MSKKEIAKFTASVGFSNDLIETGVEIATSLPIEQEISEDSIGGVVITEALAGFSELEDSARNV